MLTPDAKLRIPEQVVTRKLGEETVLLNLASSTYFGLDPVGTRFLELLETNSSLRAAVEAMESEFEVSREQLEGDVLALSEEMVAKGLLEPEA
jgi:hypothetical protein